MAKKLRSIFTGDDMSKCLVTSAMTGIEIHHIFGGANRKLSERYCYCVPLHKSVHPNGAFRTDTNWVELDHWLKRMCQEHFILHGGSREEWYNLFGRFYDDRNNERVWLNGRFTWEDKE